MINKNQLKLAGMLLLTILGTGALIGCGSSAPPVEVASDQEVAQMKNLRTIFDSVHGDYSALSLDQKQKFLDYSKGNQQAAESLWAHMQNPRGNGKIAGGNQPFAVGPGGKIMPPGTQGGEPGANR